MDSLQDNVTRLTGAVNALMDQLNGIERRVSCLDTLQNRIALIEAATPERYGGEAEVQVQPRAPATEAELRDISRLPDSVKELQVFNGNPTMFVSWVHAVESILTDFELVKGKPIYRAILQHIRQKIRGPADTALISYSIFDTDWTAMKECLSLHYADKRDIRTLEYQLHQLSQKDSRLDDFYGAVNHQFALIINKLKTEKYSQETVQVLIDTYRNRALDVFIRGLNGDLSRMLLVQRPKNLPEAYSRCLEIQNTNLRNYTVHTARFNNRIVAPMNTMPDRMHGLDGNKAPPLPPRTTWRPQERRYPFEKRVGHPAPKRDPPSTSQPAIGKTDVDQSVQSRKVNYMNRPNPFKRGSKSENLPRKQQKLFNIETDDNNDEVTNYLQTAEEAQEENFLSNGHLAYLT